MTTSKYAFLIGLSIGYLGFLYLLLTNGGIALFDFSTLVKCAGGDPLDIDCGPDIALLTLVLGYLPFAFFLLNVVLAFLRRRLIFRLVHFLPGLVFLATGFFLLLGKITCDPSGEYACRYMGEGVWAWIIILGWLVLFVVYCALVRKLNQLLAYFSDRPRV